MEGQQSHLFLAKRTAPARLLVVEDEPDSAELLEFTFQQAGYQVKVVNSASAALETLQQQAFDLAIVDWLLPDGTGAKICNEVHKKDEGTRLPVIVLSGACGEKDKAIEACAPDVYMAKPVTMQKLLFEVQHLLAQLN